MSSVFPYQYYQTVSLKLMRNASHTPYQPPPPPLALLLAPPPPPSVSVTHRKVHCRCVHDAISSDCYCYTIPIGVTVGLQQTYYMTLEGRGPVEICLTLLSGDVTGSSFTINYNTLNGLAEGKTNFEPFFHYSFS